MLSKYGFKGLDAEGCLSDLVLGNAFFPILDDEETPKGIMEKTEEMVDELLNMHQICNTCRAELYLTAIVKIELENNEMWICIKISDHDSMNDHLAEKKFNVKRNSTLYGEFKRYLMHHIEKELFGDCLNL